MSKRRMVAGGLWLLVLLPLLVYLAICVWMFVQQRSLIYFPQATRTDAANTDFTLQRDDMTLRGWQINPGQHNALIYFGGNAEAVQYNRTGFNGLLPDSTIYLLPYRGYGANPGTPEEAALIADAQALFDNVRQRHPDGRIAVMGRSLGSGVAVQLAASRPVERLILVTPFDSLADVAQSHYRWLPVRWLMHDHYDSIDHLPAYHGPLLVLRAGRDEVVPPANTDRLLRTAPPSVSVVDFPSADHNDISDSPRYWTEIQRFLESAQPAHPPRDPETIPPR